MEERLRIILEMLEITAKIATFAYWSRPDATDAMLHCEGNYEEIRCDCCKHKLMCESIKQFDDLHRKLDAKKGRVDAIHRN